MNDVVERVARAMFDAAMAERYADFPERAPQWPPSMHEIRHEWDRSARAAIKAMFDMPDKFLRIGVGYTDFCLPDGTHDNTPEGWLNEFRMAWQTVVSAALADASPDIGKEGIGNDE